MSRQFLIAGNWKMNNSISETETLINQIKNGLKSDINVDVLISPPFLSLSSAVKLTEKSDIMVASQNVHWKESGAFTGEISTQMLSEIGVNHVIIGHSERRQYFGETNKTVNLRIQSALKSNIVPILCLGETLVERESNQTFDVINSQFNTALKDIPLSDIKKIVIAYEPVWAIGTGKTATAKQAQEVHTYIRNLLPKDVSQLVRILYGGSMKPENAKELLEQYDIDGGLIGGASLKADQFCNIIEVAHHLA